MKATNNKWIAGSMKLAVGLLLAGSFLMPMATHAEPRYVGKFTLAHETRWGKKMIPAGNYTLSVDTSTKLIWVRYANTEKVAAIEIGVVGPSSQNDRNEIRIAIRGNERAVYSLQLAQFGEVYSSTHPFPKTARGAEEARTTEGSPVQVAQK